MGGQLHLFKGKRQRGTAPPSASEFQLQCAVVDTVRRWINPGWHWTHIANGEKRDIVTAARLKRMGVNRGWPDLMFFHAEGRVCFLELKRKAGWGMTEEQQTLRFFLRDAGHGYEVTHDFKIAIETLKGWGVLRSGISVQ